VYFNVNFNVFELIKVHLLVSELYIFCKFRVIILLFCVKPTAVGMVIKA